MTEALPSSLCLESETPSDLVSYIASDTRDRVGRAVEILHHGERLDPERESQKIEAIHTLDRLLRRKKLPLEERDILRDSLKILGSEDLALAALGPKGVRRYFELLSGPESDYPYCFTLPLLDDDLESYLLFELCHDDPAYQDQCVLDLIDDEPMTDAVNLLVSRLKANPDFYLKIKNDERLKGAGENPIVSHFDDVVFDAAKEEDPKGDPNGGTEPRVQKIHLSKSSSALRHLFYRKERLKKIRDYEDCIKKGRVITAAKEKKSLRKMDERYFAALLLQEP